MEKRVYAVLAVVLIVIIPAIFVLIDLNKTASNGRITGAVTGLLGTSGIVIAIVFIIAVVALALIISFKKKEADVDKKEKK